MTEVSQLQYKEFEVIFDKVIGLRFSLPFHKTEF